MRFVGIIVLIPFVVLVYLSLISPVFSYTFLSNLKIGNEGNDVRELQIALNADNVTKIADTGPGSPGNETNYFGFLTYNAVLRFQEKYRGDILTPAGVNSPTGFVGALTRLKLNTLFAKTSANSNQVLSPTDTKVPVLPAEKPTFQDLMKFDSSFSQVKPKILGLTHYDARRGDSVTVFGQGFSSEGNKIYFGNSGLYASAKSANGAELVFIVPETISDGKYYLWVENLNGTSFVENAESFFSVSEVSHSPPTIASLEPQKINISSTSSSKIMVTGTNFTPTNNHIYSSIGMIKNIPSSDGKILVFSLSDFERIAEVVDMKKNVSNGSIPIPIIIKTDYGFSNEKIYLFIEF
ncbi:MAG: hypothetical protein A2741_01040 [Candidatus Zambryskibacteria bacterium RIFCSPHIGHO2_01_FULL_43_27]|uniref:IPT/TIG domain-containing protein n=1 Tax=Candidatus Zambryskibacteria bacterium RIFCSPLOWO2_01_FULL_43_17 TaxID=1802760 RepID=A0A1G2U541_9BACT|nr:MAG: hypothetical protein A2741_01040 [Candidatus Zambryskibacteria bacterium RIFCSPHIGHO2_01_FULL_43_27]OHB00086.1 MAG: hypothetical protein A3E93_02035 [Candidatus Zambryskibacteria bacterium RIFCSPHIGHO2_12_FULL_43_12b]OHB04617.1 MAG: hypothetical protein A2920_01620 [Candidatus Zambryskibacteria bacterium RIFCSPLOWO2_01_FULL_43_17]